MPLFETDLDYTKLIQFTEGTLQLGSFVQIRNALIKRMQEIYGNDIDVSSASGDGQYINSLALLLNNIFQTIQKGYNMLDPAVATGQYLDTLCSFNNIQRIEESQSTVALYIYNNNNLPLTFNKLSFLDNNNKLWIWDNGGKDLTLAAKSYTIIYDVTCEEYGDVIAKGTGTFWYNSQTEADPDWQEVDDPDEATWDQPSLYTDLNKRGTIFQTVNSMGLYVWQYNDAEVGTIRESDEQLRSRRYQMLGNSSVTVLEGIKGNLLNNAAVKDVYIYNNPQQSNFVLEYEPIADNCSVLPHSIYIAVRYKDGLIGNDSVNIEPIDESIGQTIYEKLTPGIATSPKSAGVSDGTQGSYTITRAAGLEETVYWKKCSSKHPTIVINFWVNIANYDFPSDNKPSATENNIIEKLQNYIKEIKINDYMTIPNLLNAMQKGDIPKNGNSTFLTQNGYIGSSGTYKVAANLAYFEYKDSDYSFEYTKDGNDNYTGEATLTIEWSE